MARRILSLWLPRLASELALRQRDTQAAAMAGPFAVVARQGAADLLLCLNPAAEAHGLRAGQPLSEARALVPGLITRTHAPQAQARFLQVLRRWALRYAPWVATEGTDGLVFDITGAAHLMGGEAALCDDLHARLDAMALSPRLALAGTRGAAWALARYARGAVTIVGDDPRAVLAPMPPAALRLPEDVCTAMARVGLRQIGALADIPRAQLARRFGMQPGLRLDQALGRVAEPVNPAQDPPPFAVRLTLPEPIGLTSDVMAGLDRLLARLCERLAETGQGARHLRLDLARTDGSRAEAAIALARPMRDPPAMAALFERAVDALDAGFGFDALRLSAPLTEALPPAQLTTAHTQGSDALADLMTRLGNRIGLEGITRFLPAESHIPERAFQIAAAAFTEAPPPDAWRAGPQRPLILFPPEPLIGLTGREPPRRFRWRRRWLTTRQASGPERLSPEWWLDDPLWRSGLRDYWRVNTAEGPRLWLFFTPQTPGWAVQGEFA
ncbi:MAG: DNA polymerase Y family protein [Pararhodobacter sp.]|nr:DNA polymerase Y family protein [Pararhodobacter sp.]